MKIANEIISVLASFKPNGDIMPLRFRREDGKTINIDKIIKINSENLCENKRIVFTCLQNNKNKYEIKFEIDTHKWYLFI